ncbi:MAG: ferredoxin [Candidatus Dadabacteria bacterium]
MPKVIQYRNKCIGCGICYEMMPSSWRMSRKDGKATLVRAEMKKGIAVLDVAFDIEDTMREVAIACPVKIIKIN